MHIKSRANPRFKAARALRRRGERDRRRHFLVEGRALVEQAMAAGSPISEVWLSPQLGADKAAWTGLIDRVYTVPADMFAQLAYRRHPDGHLAVVGCFDTSLERLDLAGAGLVLVVDGAEKPGNIGAMLRTAGAFGVDGVVMTDAATDVFNPNVVRSSMGALFSVPLAVADADASRSRLAEAGLEWLPTSVRGRRSLWEVDLTDRVALVVGSEDTGLGARWQPTGPRSVRIPTRHDSGSLNVSVAAGILLGEALRQRLPRDDA